MNDPNLRDQLRQQLRDEPTTESEETPAPSKGKPNPFRKANFDDLVSFYRQFAVLVASGHPMSRSLEILSSSVDNTHLRETAARIREKVDAGRRLDEAMAEHPWYFDAANVAVVKAAHESGDLAEAMNYLAESSEHSHEVRGRIESSLAYPVILLGITLGALLLMLLFVVPAFTSALPGGGGPGGPDFSGVAAFVVSLSEFTRTWYGIPLVLLLFAAGVFLLILFRKRMPEATDRILGRVPVIGRLMLLAQTSRFTDVLHILVKHGVPLPQALSYASEGINNAYLQRAIAESREEVEAGRSMVKPLARFRNLPPVFIEMLSVGELSGDISETLKHLSRFLRRQLTNASERFAVVLQPFMLLTTGLIVVIVVLAFFLTYFDALDQLAQIE